MIYLKANEINVLRQFLMNYNDDFKMMVHDIFHDNDYIYNDNDLRTVNYDVKETEVYLNFNEEISLDALDVIWRFIQAKFGFPIDWGFVLPAHDNFQITIQVWTNDPIESFLPFLKDLFEFVEVP